MKPRTLARGHVGMQGCGSMSRRHAIIVDVSASTHKSTLVPTNIGGHIRETYRLRPSKTARLQLDEEWGRSRFVWNQINANVKEAWEQRRETTPYSEMSPTQLRKDHEWLRDGAQNPQAHTARAYRSAFAASFKVKGRGKPRWKSKKTSQPSLHYTTNGFKVDNDGRLQLAKLVSIPVVWSREDLPRGAKSVTIYKDTSGHWYASFVVKDTRVFPAAPEGSRVGFDLGVKATAIATDPAYDLPNHRRSRSLAPKLAEKQRQMARRVARHKNGKPNYKTKQSRGYEEAKRQAQQLYAKATRQAKHDIGCWAKNVVNNNETIAIEDFKPAFMAKNRGLARAAADARPGMAKAALCSLASRAGRETYLVHPAYSTQTCSSCGTIAKVHLNLDDRVFDCSECEHVEDRDRNAARNILAWAGQPQ